MSLVYLLDVQKVPNFTLKEELDIFVAANRILTE